MISERKYKKALNTVDKYRKQLTDSVIKDKLKGNKPKIDIYEWLRSEMMVLTDMTKKEFDEVLEMWIHIKEKELQIEKFKKEQDEKNLEFL